MERGTDWEITAVQHEWDVRERRRALTTRFVWGTFAVCLGLLVAVIGLAAPTITYCQVAFDVGLGRCQSVQVGMLGRGVFFTAATALVGVGGWRCLSALRTDPADCGDLAGR